jgi:organic hydroperoxide reductase OsmC/OhrA
MSDTTQHEHLATVTWHRGETERFVDQRYSRAHQWRFDGGAVVAASSSPSVVRVPMSDPTAVDPEEALVASLSSCHMLFFLSHAAARGFVVDRYEDEAVGVTGKNAAGRVAMLKATLRPHIVFGGDKQPAAAELGALHHRSHDDCFIANSVNFNVTVEPRSGPGAA